MSEFKDQWNMQLAMAVLENKTIDAKTWSEAVKWLMLYGPPEIRQLLGQASSHATREYFPDVQPRGYNEQGEPLYEISDIATALGISEEEAAQRLNEMEFAHNVRHLYDKKESRKLQ